MQKMEFIDLEKSRLAQSIASLCKQLHDAKESSGDGWETLFVLFLLARCVNAQWHDAVLPKFAFIGDQKPEVRYNEPYDNSLRCFSQCHNWKELKDGIKPSEKPQISVYFPTHAKFEAYDVVVTFSEQNRIERVYGYQLKEGSGNSKHPVESDFFRSFVVKGDPPDETLQRAGGWCIPSGMDMDDFFGESGKYWTPKEWKKLSATPGTQIACS
jgi:hypothetical protein